MKYIISVSEMKQAEAASRKALDQTNLDQILYASSCIAKNIVVDFLVGKCLVLVGPGANGLDAFYTGVELLNNKFDVYFYFFQTEEIVNELKMDYKIKTTGLDGSFDYIIDGIYGTGYIDKENTEFDYLIDKVNQMNAIRISIDIPSGLSGDTGLGRYYFMADYVYIIQAYKLGNILANSRNCMNSKVIDIGVRLNSNNKYLIGFDDFISFILPRNQNTNKGTYKRATLIAGSKELMGASILASQALSSLKLGCGYSTLAIPKSLFEIYALRYPELTLTLMPDLDGNMLYNEEALDKIIANSSVITIGMGIGKSLEVYKIIYYILNKFTGVLIIDADGLNSLAEYGIDILKEKVSTVILTPHLLEFSRISGYSLEQIMENRVKCSLSFSRSYNVTLVLKDSTTLITDGKSCYFNISGNSGLAKGGSGDILAGILSGIILGLNKKIVDSACFASFLLGYAADYLSDTQIEQAILPTDIINILGKLLKHFN